MKIIKKYIILSSFVCLIICDLCSCTLVNNLLGPVRNEEKNLTIYTVRNYMTYEYMNKVAIGISLDRSEVNDELKIKIKDEEHWRLSIDSSKIILEGKFETFAWYDDTLYILCNNKYYEFDIADYQMPNEFDEDGNPIIEYEMPEYNKDEFVSKYPNYNDFDWEKFNE